MWLTFNGTTLSMSNGTDEYIDSYANFEADSGLSVPAIHIGYISTYYEPTITHTWNTKDRADPQAMPWAEGDAILANFDATVAARDARLAPDPFDVAKQAKLDNHATGDRAAEDTPVTYELNDYDATEGALTEINSIATYVLGGETLPAGFTWITTYNIEVPFTALNVKELFVLIAKKHYQDAHKYAGLTKQVEAATTVAEIEAIPDW